MNLVNGKPSKNKSKFVIGFLISFMFVQPAMGLATNEISVYNQISVSEIIDRYIVDKDYKKRTDLCAIMTACGSDKGNRHNYTTLYGLLFSAFKDESLNVFELGLGTNNVDVPSNMGPRGIPGASLYGWAHYFPNSRIFGADIDTRILFQADKISTFFCDQRDETSIKEMFSNNVLKDLSFDIMVEDGLHEFEANLTFLENSIVHLKNGGIYIVEDLQPITASKFEEILPRLRSEFRHVILLIVPIDDPTCTDNTLLIIQK